MNRQRVEGGGEYVARPERGRGRCDRAAEVDARLDRDRDGITDTDLDLRSP